MESKAINFITIGYAKQALALGSREHERMKGYAEKISSLHVIVFTRRDEHFGEPLYDGRLTVHPTNSAMRPLMLFDALLIGFRLLKRAPRDTWVISSQDPFETSLVGRLLSFVTGVRHHVQLHGDNFSGGAWRSESLSNWIRYWFGLYILRSAECIRVASLRIKHSLENHGVATQCITVLPIRPEIERFFNTPHTVHEHDSFTFLATSRFSQEKNIPLMIRSFYTIHKEFPHTQLRLVGAGTEAGTIQMLIESLGIHSSVTMLPWSATVEKEMQEADAFLLASNHEAYGLTLVEALAVGLPIITTDVGCVGEVIKAEVHGLVVPVGDETAFTNAMRRMITDYAFRVRVSGAEKSTAEMLRAISQHTYNEQWVASILCKREAV